MENGADPLLKNEEGITPLKLVKKSDDQKLDDTFSGSFLKNWDECDLWDENRVIY